MHLELSNVAWIQVTPIRASEKTDYVRILRSAYSEDLGDTGDSQHTGGSSTSSMGPLKGKSIDKPGSADSIASKNKRSLGVLKQRGNELLKICSQNSSLSNNSSNDRKSQQK